MSSEIWLDIPEWPGYQASSAGRIRRGALIKSAFADRKGYLKVKLWSSGKSKNRLVHRLVASSFLGPIPEGMVCCHIDGNNTENKPENLKYDTPKGNEADKRLHGTIGSGERHPASILTQAQALEIRRRYVYRGGKNSARSLAKEFGVTHALISLITTGKIWRSAK